MTRNVNQGRAGWTELRVHGVSGTPPEQMLQHSQVETVAGDTDAAFFRRRFESPAASADTDRARVEAYSWGAMTAGAGQRALWLLLTPFMLVNVAYFTLPAPPSEDGLRPAPPRRTKPEPGSSEATGPTRAQGPTAATGAQGPTAATGETAKPLSPVERRAAVTRTLAEAVMRLFALTITVTFVLVAVQVAMDLIGWQCVRPDGRDCTADATWLHFLTWSWLDEPGRRLAVTALLPLAAVALLGWLGRTTWLRLERTGMPEADPGVDRQTPLENRQMWNGEDPVRRLRAVHLTAALAVVGVFLSAPLSTPAATVVLVLLVTLLGLTVVLVCRPRTVERPPPAGPLRPPIRLDAYAVLEWVAGALVAAAITLAFLTGENRLRPGQSLPALLPMIPWLVTVQLALLLLLAVLLVRLNRAAGARPQVWHGLTAAGLMTLAFVLIGGFAAGIGIRVADLLGTPAVEPVSPIAFIVPDGYFLAAAATPVLAAVLIILAVIGWRVLDRAAVKVAPELDAYYPELAAEGTRHHQRRDRIARIWARAEVGDVGQRLIGWFLVITAAALVTGLVLSWVNGTWLLDHARWLVNVGTFLIGGFVLALLFVGRQAYRNPRFRRTVGVLWDIGTFWPRAAHPLAPPCYTERAVPDLITRIRHLGEKGRVLLSCHSQGAVIGTAVLMQLRYEESASVALLTYGSPVHRLYGRFFPEYFGPTALHRAGSSLLGTTDAPRETWPWRNLYRRSDPIGGEIFQRHPAQALAPDAPPSEVRAGDTNDVDRELIDPGFTRVPGDTCDPASCGHSNYYADPAFDAAAEKVRDLRGDAPGDSNPIPVQRPSRRISKRVWPIHKGDALTSAARPKLR
ncbi:hypothetical protein [Actinoplanes sp. M2I2]|uniref:hypothetical protein n=1 Tax=Actinoplanes sp. M2I2 TaxID=1734444 RepID=UPI0020217944|nr:hypothetical protein [Actinoplanes sp. M2I2]